MAVHDGRQRKLAKIWGQVGDLLIVWYADRTTEGDAEIIVDDDIITVKATGQGLVLRRLFDLHSEAGSRMYVKRLYVRWLYVEGRMRRVRRLWLFKGSALPGKVLCR
jgi:hypothetical protein